MNTPVEELKNMGENGRILMEEKYAVEAVAENFEQLYKWIMGMGDKPSFVFSQE